MIRFLLIFGLICAAWSHSIGGNGRKNVNLNANYNALRKHSFNDYPTSHRKSNYNFNGNIYRKSFKKSATSDDEVEADEKIKDKPLRKFYSYYRRTADESADSENENDEDTKPEAGNGETRKSDDEVVNEEDEEAENEAEARKSDEESKDAAAKRKHSDDEEDEESEEAESESRKSEKDDTAKADVTSTDARKSEDDDSAESDKDSAEARKSENDDPAEEEKEKCDNDLLLDSDVKRKSAAIGSEYDTATALVKILSAMMNV